MRTNRYRQLIALLLAAFAALFAAAPALATDVTINISAGQTITRGSDINENAGNLSITGAGPTSVLDFAGFKCVWSGSGTVTINNCTLKNAGSVSARALDLTSTGTQLLQSVTFDACGQVYSVTTGRRQILDCEYKANSTVLVDASASNGDSCYLGGSGASRAATPNQFLRNRWRKGRVFWDATYEWDIADSVCDGDRGAMYFQNCNGRVRVSNCLLCPDYYFVNGDPTNWSQVAAMSTVLMTDFQSDGVILGKGHWPLRGLAGKFTNGVIFRCNGHNYADQIYANGELSYSILLSTEPTGPGGNGTSGAVNSAFGVAGIKVNHCTVFPLTTTGFSTMPVVKSETGSTVAEANNNLWQSCASMTGGAGAFTSATNNVNSASGLTGLTDSAVQSIIADIQAGTKTIAVGRAAIQALATPVAGSAADLGGGAYAGAIAPAATVDFLAEVLVTAKAKADANTADAAAFKTRLSGALNNIGYTSSDCLTAGDYALAYRAWKTADPTFSQQCWEKGVALVRLGVEGNFRDVFSARSYLGRGTGALTTFTIPDATRDAATLKVYLAPVSTSAVVRGGTANGRDVIANYAGIGSRIIKVSNTNDGTADYAETTAWLRGPLGGGSDPEISWSPGGSEPAAGATYYVTRADHSANAVLQTLTTQYTVSGTTITFVTPPPTSQAVVVEYLYTDSNGNRYQQRADGYGYHANPQYDTTYSTRGLAYLAAASNWLSDHPNFGATGLDTLTGVWFKDWTDWIIANGYFRDAFASNYAAGHLAMVSAVYCDLLRRDPTTAATYATWLQNWWTTVLLPTVNTAGPMVPADGLAHATLIDGNWGEGWNYGNSSVKNYAVYALVMNQHGLADITPFRDWCSRAVTTFIHSQAHLGTVLDTGDYNFATYPVDVTASSAIYQDIWGTLGYVAGDATAKKYANWLIQNATASKSNTLHSIAFVDPAGTTSNPTAALPTGTLIRSEGYALWREDWSYAKPWVMFHAGNIIYSGGHIENSMGMLEIWDGTVDLLPNAEQIGSAQDNFRSFVGNAVLISDNGAGNMTYAGPPFGSGPSQGFWWNASQSGQLMEAYVNATGYGYARGNYAPAYGKNSDGVTLPVTTLKRSVLYARSAKDVIVYDRATALGATYKMQLQFCFGSSSVAGHQSVPYTPPTITQDAANNAWTIDKGSKKLHGKTYSTRALTSGFQDVATYDSGRTVRKLITNPSVQDSATIRYVTALQVKPTAAATAHVVGSGSVVEGVKVGDVVAMFGRSGSHSGDTYSVTETNGVTDTHYVADLSPSTNYSLTGADQASATSDSAGVLTFTTTGTGSAQSVTIGAGVGGAPDLSVPQVANGGTDARGTVALNSTRSYTLTNAGSATLTITGLTRPATTTQTTSIGPGTTIAPGASVTLTLRFDATTSGPVSINSDDPDAPYAWTLTATVDNPPTSGGTGLRKGSGTAHRSR